MKPIVRKITWEYGITTVPARADNLFDSTLQSLKLAGFESPRLFVDGEGSEFSKLHLPMTQRKPAVRTFANWLLGLWELYLRNPFATYYAMFQDDFVTYRNLRQYLEQIKYPKMGYWNLFTFPENEPIDTEHRKLIGWHPATSRGKGAVALIFDRETAAMLLHQKSITERPRQPKGFRRLDGTVHEALTKHLDYREMIHSPSLVQHIGIVSSMGNKQWPEALSFRGEDFDALELLKEQK